MTDDTNIQPGEPDWWQVLWLAAIDAEVDPEDVRRHWNVKDAPNLDAILERAEKIELGRVYAWEPDE